MKQMTQVAVERTMKLQDETLLTVDQSNPETQGSDDDDNGRLKRSSAEYAAGTV